MPSKVLLQLTRKRNDTNSGQIKKKKLSCGYDVYQFGRLQEKKRQQDDYKTVQEGMKLSKDAERLYPDVDGFIKSVIDLRSRIVYAQARLDGVLAAVPHNIGNIKEANRHVRDLYGEVKNRSICDV